MTTTSNGKSLMVQGRIVWTSGNLFAGQHQKDDRTKQLQFNQDGSPKIVYGFGLAIPKTDPATGQFTPQWVELYQAMHGEALTLYPSGNIPPAFSMKYKDGDVDVDPAGKKYSEREGYPGHIVLACTTQLPIKYFRFEGGNNILVNDGIKNGDYVNVQLTIKAHPAVGQGKAGLYVNPSAVQLIQSGKEIINTPSGDQLFGVAAPTYAGQMEAPVAPTMPQMGQAPMMPNPAMMNPGQAPVVPMPQQTQAAPTPHYGVLPQTHQPQQAPIAPPMGAPGMQPMGAPGMQPMGAPGMQPMGQPAMTPPMPR